jgi:hypothetical protein
MIGISTAATVAPSGRAPSSPYTENAGGVRFSRERSSTTSKGEQLHKSGKHAESMETLGKAKKMLGI